MFVATTEPFEAQTTGEELANAITHGAGAALSLVGTVVLVLTAVRDTSPVKVISLSVFGASLFALYLSSTIYHGLRPSLAKRVFHILDHSAIFLLIAGTYTPVTLLALQGSLGWALFGINWGAALVGILVTACCFERARRFNLALYLVMGWLVVISGPQLFAALDRAATFWLLAGGLSYTVGVVFYRLELRFHHMVWHLFVLMGSVCHFFMMLRL